MTWGIFFFGSILGGCWPLPLAGITATLIGLLYADRHVVLLSWSDLRQVEGFAGPRGVDDYIGRLALGMWAGLLFGFLLRGAEIIGFDRRSGHKWQKELRQNPDDIEEGKLRHPARSISKPRRRWRTTPWARQAGRRTDDQQGPDGQQQGDPERLTATLAKLVRP